MDCLFQYPLIFLVYYHYLKKTRECKALHTLLKKTIALNQRVRPNALDTFIQGGILLPYPKLLATVIPNPLPAVDSSFFSILLQDSILQAIFHISDKMADVPYRLNSIPWHNVSLDSSTRNWAKLHCLSLYNQ